MTPQEFRQARKALKLTQPKLADALGLSKSQIALFEHGRRYDTGDPVEVPKHIRLAMVALHMGQTDWPPKIKGEE